MLTPDDKKTCKDVADMLWNIGLGNYPSAPPTDILIQLEALIPKVTEDRLRLQLQRAQVKLTHYVKIAQLKAEIATLTGELTAAEQIPLKPMDLKYLSKDIRNELN